MAWSCCCSRHRRQCRKATADRYPIGFVEKELRRRSVTRLLLWEEYRAANPDGFGYTWFCTTFEAWKKRARPTMRQTHMGGEKVFVDFAGDTIDVIDPITGEAHAMKLFVAAMGASNYDSPKLGELPDQPYVFARWKRCRVAPDYHVEIDGHWYSTPYRLIRELVDVRIADKTVEIFHKGQRITSHARAPNRRGHTTIADHMPSAHRRYGKWTPGGLIAAGERIGPSTAKLSSLPDLIPSKAFAPASASCRWPGATAMCASMPPADAASSSRLAPSPRSVRSSRTVLIALSSTTRSTTNPCATATSAVRAISTEPFGFRSAINSVNGRHR